MNNDPVKTELRAFSLCEFDALCVYLIKIAQCSNVWHPRNQDRYYKNCQEGGAATTDWGMHINNLLQRLLNRMLIAAEGSLQGCIFLTHKSSRQYQSALLASQSQFKPNK